MVQEFLLAAMIICLEFDHLKTRSQDITATPEEEVMLQALQKSYSIWQESSASSTEAHKASTVLRILLEKCSGDVGKKKVVNCASSEVDPWLTPATDGKYTLKFSCGAWGLPSRYSCIIYSEYT